jgi:hypothetical protein
MNWEEKRNLKLWLTGTQWMILGLVCKKEHDSLATGDDPELQAIAADLLEIYEKISAALGVEA